MLVTEHGSVGVESQTKKASVCDDSKCSQQGVPKKGIYIDVYTYIYIILYIYIYMGRGSVNS